LRPRLGAGLADVAFAPQLVLALLLMLASTSLGTAGAVRAWKR
jgi:hypothetical protein